MSYAHLDGALEGYKRVREWAGRVATSLLTCLLLSSTASFPSSLVLHPLPFFVY